MRSKPRKEQEVGLRDARGSREMETDSPDSGTLLDFSALIRFCASPPNICKAYEINTRILLHEASNDSVEDERKNDSTPNRHDPMPSKLQQHDGRN